ncbi:hypothetical protein HZH68_004351 [Vespula germanica]|uniref:Uncharacterized protein n=1 Tax=Vespula germanica TaxID=30212 RepID=A0A834NI86_VESGE|nr:hypothetical protein HZH68_004351 [Vespula germanica]
MFGGGVGVGVGIRVGEGEGRVPSPSVITLVELDRKADLHNYETTLGRRRAAGASSPDQSPTLFFSHSPTVAGSENK